MRRRVESVDVVSAGRVVFAVSLSLWAIAFVGLVALYLLGLVSGGLGGVEGFIASLGFTGFRLSILPFLAVFAVVAVVVSAVLAVVAGLFALLYNAVAPLAGGVEVRVTTEMAAPVADVPPPAVEAPQVWSPPAEPTPLPTVPPVADERAQEYFGPGG